MVSLKKKKNVIYHIIFKNIFSKNNKSFFFRKYHNTNFGIKINDIKDKFNFYLPKIDKRNKEISILNFKFSFQIDTFFIN